MARKAITPIIAVVMMLLMTVAAAGAVFTWYQQFQQQQLQQVSKAASALAKNIQFSIPNAKWYKYYPQTDSQLDLNDDGTWDVNVTYVLFTFTLQNNGDDIDLKSTNPPAYPDVADAITGDIIATGEPVKWYFNLTNSINDYITGKNIFTTNDAGEYLVPSPIECKRYSPTKLDHPDNIVATGETAQFYCTLVLSVEKNPSTTLAVQDYQEVNYDPTGTYQIDFNYGAVVQSAQILK